MQSTWHPVQSNPNLVVAVTLIFELNSIATTTTTTTPTSTATPSLPFCAVRAIMPGLVSVSEQDYILRGVACNIRGDGRKNHEFRPIFLETGIISQASGSSRVKSDITDVVVGIKFEVETFGSRTDDDQGDDYADDRGIGRGADDPLHDAADDIDADQGAIQDRGRVVCNVECSPSASRSTDRRELENMALEYSEFMNRVLNAPHGGIDLKALLIVPKTSCWVIYIDVLVLDMGGSLLDTIFLATRAAMGNARMAKVLLEQVGGRYEYDISDDETEIVKGWEDIPITITFYKIGERFVVDASIMEELCSESRFVVAINRHGRLCAVQKAGLGRISPNLMTQILQTAPSIGLSVMKRLERYLTIETERISKRQDPLGFLGDYSLTFHE
ncbi:hypothetical protein SeMB42_g03469 [Synchytrium endobioticum]|uniref:Ribosomal RNA-processing protein 42 n=1 Tax=Synchytrium endobioticum TaxID=286115 RepID=A0A507D852_9FUNG|nr:hypothetical protein SeMB42_g03469 [Synchytrium endobioticum]TPX47732.1 hypothetical protein SeLEV6574_g02497 [Synchytrium endobioticum]